MIAIEIAQTLRSLHQVMLRCCRPCQVIHKQTYSVRSVIQPFDDNRSGNAFDFVFSTSKLAAVAGECQSKVRNDLHLSR